MARREPLAAAAGPRLDLLRADGARPAQLHAGDGGRSARRPGLRTHRLHAAGAHPGAVQHTVPRCRGRSIARRPRPAESPHAAATPSAVDRSPPCGRPPRAGASTCACSSCATRAAASSPSPSSSIASRPTRTAASPGCSRAGATGRARRLAARPVLPQHFVTGCQTRPSVSRNLGDRLSFCAAFHPMRSARCSASISRRSRMSSSTPRRCCRRMACSCSPPSPRAATTPSGGIVEDFLPCMRRRSARAPGCGSPHGRQRRPAASPAACWASGRGRSSAWRVAKAA